jgi:hypothetical protein
LKNRRFFLHERTAMKSGIFGSLLFFKKVWEPWVYIYIHQMPQCSFGINLWCCQSVNCP